MSSTAEDVSASLNDDSSALNPTDQIADLLIGSEPESQEDGKDDESQTLESNLDEDESNDESEAQDDDGEEGEEADLEVIADDDASWEGVLGIAEDKLSFDDDGNLEGVHVKVNDFEGTLTIPELVASYQTNKAIGMKGDTLGEERKAFNSQKEQVEQVYTSKLEAVDALSTHFEKQLISAYDNVDWDKLRVEDPAEYAAARQDYAAKAGELQRIQEAINSDKEAANLELSQNNLARQQTLGKEQYDKMLEKNPEWSDEKVRNKAQAEFKDFVMEQYGFEEADWNLVRDARLIELIKDAKKLHEGVSVATKKRLKQVPKFQKSRGAGTKAKTSKLEKLTNAASKAKGGAKRDLQSSAVAELLLGGT